MTLDNSSSTHFTLSYHGRALADHSMSVRQLGPAITAFGELLDRTNYLLNSDRSTIDTKATTTRSGSFGIDFAVEVVRVGATIFSGQIVVSALNIRQLVTLAITWLKYLNREGKKATNWTEDEAVQAMESIGLRVDGIELNTIATPETNRAVLATVEHLSRDRILLEHLRQTATPVSQDGIERVSLLDNNSNVLESIEEADLPALEPLPQDATTQEHTTQKKTLTVITPYLGQGNAQWSLRDGTRTETYNMMDKSFAADVRNRAVAFRSNDVLVCEVRYIHSLDGEGNITGTTREILKVHSHSQIDQPPLPGM